MNLDLVGRFGSSGIDIEGTAKSMLEFSQRVLQIRTFEVFELGIPSIPPSPYAGYLRFLRFDLDEGNVHIRREGDSLLIRGSTEKVGFLARNIASLASQETDGIATHSHIEYHPDHFYLVEGSEPLVLTKRDV